MVIYRTCDTGVFCLSITGTENFQYRPLLPQYKCDNKLLVPSVAILMKFHCNLTEMIGLNKSNHYYRELIDLKI